MADKEHNYYFVFPDIHGMYDLMEKGLDKISEYASNFVDPTQVIFLGDYIDRGPDSLKVVQYLMKGQDIERNLKFHCLMGNHEDMFVETLHNGTHEYYDEKCAKELITSADIDNIIDWMDRLVWFKIVDKNIFVHADWDETKTAEQQSLIRMFWTKRGVHEPFYSNEFYLTHGHVNMKHAPILAPNRCNLDAGAVYNNRLVIGKYKYNNKGPIEFIEIKGE